MRSTVRRRTATLIGLSLLTVGGGLVATQQPAHDGRPLADLRAMDTDGDGLRDEEELAGWRTQRGVTYVTDPDDSDSDDDGLSDGAEAGHRSVNPAWGGAAYTGRSDPNSGDSDGDHLDDATEADARLDAWKVDTDGDGLEDFDEIEFGSDPLLADADGDQRADAAELAEGSDPFTYDLSGEERWRALMGEVWVVNELSDNQRDSWHFLLGSILRELGGGTDAIRIVQSVASLEPRRIVEAFVKAVPVAGDAIAIADRAKDFATRGKAAACAASYLISTSGLLDEDGRMTALRAVLNASADAGRLSQDLAIDGASAPPALSTTRPTSQSAHLNARKELIVGDLPECGYTDIRVNQQQVDSSGELAGDNRPDIQATSPAGIREHWVLDGDPTGTGRLHELRILANDQEAVVHVVTGTDLSTCVQ